MNTKIGFGIFCAMASLLLALAAHAQDKPLGDFKDWQAYSFAESGKKDCVVWAKPKTSSGKYKRRGDVRVFVAHRRWTQRVNEMSLEAGYAFKPDSEVLVTIDGKAFTLFTDGGTAWNRATKDDRRMVKAMRVGKILVVEGVSSRGTKTKDTYSLFGFTAAHNAINKACKVK